MLKQIAQLLLSNVRHCDIVARYGGEEFVILLPETSRKNARTMVRRLVHAVNDHAFPREDVLPTGRLTVSAGVAALPQDASTAKELIMCADKALYAAKAAGKNTVRIYNPQVHKRTKES